jgi:hypothetical protein
MCGDSGTTVVSTPGASVPDYELSPEEKKLLGLQTSSLESSLPMIQQYSTELFPSELAIQKSRNAMVQGLLSGDVGALPSAYGDLMKGLSEGETSELYNTAKRNTESEANRLGILNSGVTAELLNKSNTAIANASASYKRNQMSNLLNLAMGQPMTAVPTAASEANSAINTITDMGQGERAYELAAAQARKPSYNYLPYDNSFDVGGMLGGLGSLAGGMGALGMKLFFACLPEGTLIKINKYESLHIEDLAEGDNIWGGKILKIQMLPCSKMKFVDVITPKGKVTCSIDHPIHEKVLEVKRHVKKYRYAYDILTTSGHYFVGDVEVGSSIKMPRKLRTTKKLQVKKFQEVA